MKKFKFLVLIVLGLILSGCGAIGHQLTHVTKSEHPRYMGSKIDIVIATAIFTENECYTDVERFSLCALGPLVFIDVPFTFFLETISPSNDRHTSYVFTVKD